MRLRYGRIAAGRARLSKGPGGRAVPLEFVRRLAASGEISSIGLWVLVATRL